MPQVIQRARPVRIATAGTNSGPQAPFHQFGIERNGLNLFARLFRAPGDNAPSLYGRLPSDVRSLTFSSQGASQQHFDIGLVTQAPLRRQVAGCFEIFPRDPQGDGLSGLFLSQQPAQREGSFLFHPPADLRFNLRAMCVPPLRFLGLAGKLWDNYFLCVRLCPGQLCPHSFMNNSAVCLSATQPVIGRMASLRTANTMVRMRPASHRPHRDPARFVGISLIFQENMIPRKYVFGIEAGDPVFPQVPFIVHVPVEFVGSVDISIVH